MNFPAILILVFRDKACGDLYTEMFYKGDWREYKRMQAR